MEIKFKDFRTMDYIERKLGVSFLIEGILKDLPSDDEIYSIKLTKYEYSFFGDRKRVGHYKICFIFKDNILNILKVEFIKNTKGGEK